ncbi:unnamed protein product, partial [Meganyctiphanes norvegica]
KNVCEYQRVELVYFHGHNNCSDNDTDCITTVEFRTESTSNVSLQNQTVTIFACCPGWARFNGSMEPDNVTSTEYGTQPGINDSSEGCIEKASSETRYNDYGDLVSWGDDDYLDLSEENLVLNDKNVKPPEGDKIDSNSNENLFDIAEYVSDSADISNTIHPKHKTKINSFSKSAFEKNGVQFDEGHKSSKSKTK